jgi:selenocysteine lyase/cysteine desulfurase
MDATRRHILKGLGCVAVAGAAGSKASELGSTGKIAGREASSASFPRKTDFKLRDDSTYINCAYTHPMPTAAAESARQWILSRSQPDQPGPAPVDLKAEYASLINASPREIAFIPNTSTGENLVVKGLGLPESGGNVVTDALHFEGALIHLQELQKRGLDLRIVMPRDTRIEIRDLERVIDRSTKLVEISHVAMFTGFQHDLKAVCDLAHANGAVVYADVAQSAGCTPIDVKATGLDFCACSSFKWLMGDFGLGFLYVREDLMDRVIRRSDCSYYQAATVTSHFLLYDEPGISPLTYELSHNAAGHFEVSTLGYAARAALGKSLPYIGSLGVANIESYRQPMLQRLHKEMPALGFEPMTPPESKSALISFACKDVTLYADRLKKANVNVRLGPHFIRLSPSVFNDMSDIERFLEAVATP